ncbi:MAG: hypothetical protein M0Z70_02085, partial [Nitrospiraceae bacterium]|nr:hypothetical protein [Nitrospiraceae bacterium]
MDGFSSLHESHHDAQKLSKTTFPFRSEIFHVLPSVSFSSNEGASSPTAALFFVVSSVFVRKSTAAMPIARIRSKITPLFFIH